MKTLHIIYVPGLGDGYDRYRSLALKHWRRKGVTAELLPMHWTDRDETAEQKVRRLQSAIKSAKADRVVLIGESAGGAVVTNEAFRSDTQVSKVITICGKNVRSDRVSPRLYLKNPAFKAIMQDADNSISSDKASLVIPMTVFYSKFDSVIRLVDTKVPGAKIRILPTTGHLLSILTVLFFLKNRIISEALSG